MRLPQSITQSLSVRVFHFLTIGMAIALVGLVPVSAGAATPQLTAQLTCSPAFLRFGDIVVGQTGGLLVSVTNSGSTSVTVSAITVSNSEFVPPSLSLPLVLLAGQSVDLTISFTPTAIGWTHGTIQFSSNASNPTLTFDVRGTGVSGEPASASPSTVPFGDVAVGSSSTLPVALKNNSQRSLTVSALQTMGNGFSASASTLPVTLAAGQSITLSVTFTPQSAGATGGSIFVSGPWLVIPLTGTGTLTGQLVVGPAPLNFGNVPVGTTTTQPITVSAVGGSVTVSSAASSSSQFVLDGASFPLAIAAGQSMSFNVAFSPKSSGTLSGSLSFISNASDSKAVESLTGVGTVTQYSVNLMWNSSTSATGYNVYRSTAANGTYSKINSATDPNTAYTDSTVVSGQTYYYAATSVSSSGQESARSSPVQAAVP